MGQPTTQRSGGARSQLAGEACGFACGGQRNAVPIIDGSADRLEKPSPLLLAHHGRSTGFNTRPFSRSATALAISSNE
jgi:hypothetical protein